MRWKCMCKCGNTTVVSEHGLVSGHRKSCGKCVPDKFDLTGQRFGKLIVVREDGRIRASRAWLCACDCGETTRVPQGSLTRKVSPTHSCGCLLSPEEVSKRNTKHGMSRHPLYRTWSGIITRCYNKNDPSYVDYGGRGVEVCDRWLESFENFYRDMGEKPSAEYQIDRMDNDGPYSPENCHWVEPRVNQQNKRNSLVVTLKGETFGSVLHAAEVCSMSASRVMREAVVEKRYL